MVALSPMRKLPGHIVSLALAFAVSACVGAEAARQPMATTMNRDPRAASLRTAVFTDPVTGFALPYRLFVPQSCSPQSPCGLLLFLHGAGERGHDNQAQLANDALAFVESAPQAENPTIVVYPQCPEGMQWVTSDWKKGTYSLAHTPVSKPMAAVLELLASLTKDYAVDPARILVTGLSMGGYGTWDIVARKPNLFAGALALCGGGDPSQASAIRDLAVWAFHGERDEAVPVRGSRKMIAALRDAGGHPRYTEVAGHGHDIWTVAYRDPAAVRWLLSQRRAGK
jgi:predicted peptidase